MEREEEWGVVVVVAVVVVVVVAVAVSRWESRIEAREEDAESSVEFFLLLSPWRRTSSAFSMSSKLTPCRQIKSWC